MRLRADCGRETGYRSHRSRGEVPCQLCCDGHALAMAQWRARARVSAPDDLQRYQLARLGREPAEALTSDDRRRLVAELAGLGWDVTRVAGFTRTTTYTTGRIFDELGLSVARPDHARGAA